VLLSEVKAEAQLVSGTSCATFLATRSNQASSFFVALFIIVGLDHRFHWSEVAPAVILISDGFVVHCFFVVFLVLRENSCPGRNGQARSRGRLHRDSSSFPGTSLTRACY
jgi:hypothetical protein